MLSDKILQDSHQKNWHENYYSHSDRHQFPKQWRRFIELDLFNDPVNRVEGYICLRPCDLYGALEITEVNGRPAPQPLIYATPKTSYPFAKTRDWLIGDGSYEGEIQAYEKIDGTNIFQYTYLDADGNPFTTFKLRTRFGLSAHFAGLLEQALVDVPGLRDLVLPPGTGLGYELYGTKNPMLIRYDADIALRLLYGRQGSEMVALSNSDFFDSVLQGLSVPRAQEQPWNGLENFHQAYQDLQQHYTEGMVELAEDFWDGKEGAMLYVPFKGELRGSESGFTRLIKLKSLQVQEVHWRSEFIPEEEIAATARNMWEVSDEPDLETLRELLSEDWSDTQLDKTADRISKVFYEVVDNRRIQNQIVKAVTDLGITQQDFLNDRASVMRQVSPYFAKNDMTKVFKTLQERL